MRIKITKTKSDFLTVGKVYDVIEFRVSQCEDEDGDIHMVTGCDITDDDGDIYTIANFDEAEYNTL